MASVLDVFTWTPELWEEQTAACKVHLENIWEKIPLLNDSTNTFREGQVVRFRGMIQDGLGLNIHIASYKVVNTLTGDVVYRTGKYRQSFLMKANEEVTESEKYIDCYSFNCVEVPELNPWAKKYFLRSSSMLAEEKGPRKRVFDEMMEDCEEMDVEMKDVKCGKEGEGESSKTEPNTASNSANEIKSCTVKFFEKEGNELQLNSVIDAIGFYSAYEPHEDQDNGIADNGASLLLVLNFRKLEHTCPLLPMMNFKSEVTRITSSSADALHNISALFLPLLQGDTVAFDFFLMNLVSHVFFRNSNRELVKGQLSVNLISIPASMEYGRRMCAIIKQVVPKTLYLRCNRENLNTGSLVPFKDHDTEKLVQRPLQLAMGTIIVVDETAMDEGHLSRDGAMNILHLTNMVCRQSLFYNFVYSDVEYHTDYPTLIFSEQKSMLKADVVVRLKPQQYIKSDELRAAFEAANHFLTNESAANSIRAFLAAARHAYTGLGDETMEKYVTEDFINMRDTNPSFGPDDFDRLLLLARWYALSRGKHCVDEDVWQRVKELDQARIANLTS